MDSGLRRNDGGAVWREGDGGPGGGMTGGDGGRDGRYGGRNDGGPGGGGGGAVLLVAEGGFEAVVLVVVDHAGGLHVGVADCRADEFEAAGLEVFGHGV